MVLGRGLRRACGYAPTMNMVPPTTSDATSTLLEMMEMVYTWSEDGTFLLYQLFRASGTAENEPSGSALQQPTRALMQAPARPPTAACAAGSRRKPPGPLSLQIQAPPCAARLAGRAAGRRAAGAEGGGAVRGGKREKVAGEEPAGVARIPGGPWEDPVAAALRRLLGGG